ncbi:hypothetical protein L6R53_12470 [Myxococcota bacterium]|nr:hypothetical protein [Myxococcota bacterium]
MPSPSPFLPAVPSTSTPPLPRSALLLLWTALLACDGGKDGDGDGGDGGSPDGGADGGLTDGGGSDGGTTDGGGSDGGTTDGGADGGTTDGGTTDGGTTDGGTTDGGTSSDAPELAAGEAETLPVPTATGLPPVTGFTVNADVQPHGQPCAWRVDYGTTEALGSSTEDRALPPRLDAWFRETWSEDTNGWRSGIYGAQLSHVSEGGPDGGPFVRYTDDGTRGNDTNHLDGIGIIHLGLYGYIGTYDDGPDDPLYLGGGFPDLRGARFSMDLRGVDWEPHGTEIGTWIQAYRDPSVVEVVPEDSRYPNWAFTGSPLTDHLSSGEWERAEWTLDSRTQDWTFAGANGGRLLYDYGELEALLSAVNVNLFPIQILYVDLYDQPRGAIDYDNLEIRFRQHSVLATSNGGRLVEAPSGGTDTTTLTDGWRNGPDHEWASPASPTAPVELVYAFEDPITLYSFTIHNSTTWPSDRVRVLVSPDSGKTWEQVGGGAVPPVHPNGANYLFLRKAKYTKVEGVNTWSPLYDDPVDMLKVSIESGHQAEYWGLGEIEAFGLGAVQETEDDWVAVSRDVLVEPGTWHYQVQLTCRDGSASGPLQTVEVPALTSATGG